MKAFIKKYLFEIAIIFFFSLTPLLWLRGGEVVIGHDSVYRLTHMQHALSDLFSWNTQINFGVSWPYARGYLPVNLLEELFLRIGGSFTNMQIMEFIFWFFVMGVSMYTFARAILPEKKFRPFRILSSILYMYNFYILQGWAVADRGRFSVAAGLPILLAITINVFYGSLPLSTGAMLFGLTTLVFNGNGLPPLIGSEFISWGFAVLVFTILRVRTFGIKGFLFGLKVGVFFLLAFAIGNAYWLWPLLRFTAGRFGSSVDAIGGVNGLIDWLGMVSKYASITNILRLQGIPDWYDNAQHAYSSIYLHMPLLIVLSFIPFAVILFGLYRIGFPNDKRRRDVFLFLLLLLVAGIFFVEGSHPPFGVMFIFLVRHIPVFGIFRTSFYKFAPMVWFPMIVLFSYFYYALLHRYVKNAVWVTVISLATVCGVVLYHFPYFYPNAVFHLNQSFTTKVTVPSYVSDVSSYMEKNISHSGRILLMPKLDTGYIGSPLDTSVWGYYSLEPVINLTTTRTFLTNSSNDDFLTILLYDSLYRGNSAEFLRLAARAGVTHILWRGDIRLTDGTLHAYSLTEMEDRLSRVDGIQPVFASGLWKLYALPQSHALPMVTASQSNIVVQGSSIHDAYLLNSPMISPSTITLRTGEEMPEYIRPITRTLVSEAECYMCHTDEYQQQVKGLTLPQTKILPGNPLYGTVQKKESLALAKVENIPNERIDANLAFSLVRISEMQRLIQDNRSEQTITLTSDAYIKLLADIKNNVSKFKDRQADIYGSRILSYLDAQVQWLSPVQSQIPRAFTYLLEMRGDISKIAWMTEDQANPRFGVTVIEDGMYSLYAPGDMNAVVYIDGTGYQQTESVELHAGYHRIELRRPGSRQEAAYPYPILFLLKQVGIEQTGVPPSISFRMENPTLYTVHVSATSAYVLRFGQHFDRGWTVIIKNTIAPSLPISEDKHFVADGFANAWYISKSGEYDVIISYAPQKDFVMGVVVSILGIVLSVGTLGFMVIMKRKR